MVSILGINLFGRKITDKETIKKLLSRIKNMDRFYLNSYLQEVQGKTNRTVKVTGRIKISLGSYSYLGLIGHKKIEKAAIQAIKKYGTGAGGVRLLTGNSTIHKQLEQRIANFKATEDAIVFSSGYVTNMCTIAALFGKDDLVIIDKFDHQSIYDACILSGVAWLRFNHNDLHELETILQDNIKRYKRILIVVDAVYSMDGDIADIPEIIRLAKKYKAFTMVDEAHSLGVLGEHGKGLKEYFNLKSADIDIWMGTLSKAIPAIGGYIAGKKEMITYLRYSAHGFVFSAALPPSVCASAIAAFDIIEKDTKRHKQLKNNISYFLTGVKRLGFNTLMSKDTAIIPVMIGSVIKTFRFAKKCNDLGVFVCPIVYPAVPKDAGRLRCCVMATHTKKDLDNVLRVFEKVGKELSVV
ncbi:aminotransferase class I/II-fold pyridoxal phosphate-dependent enzyme [Candidatus Woesearchaeota archaeon]|nr:aminotransferase class I/II-fold pyridoxal phosphate-dependent enzyme [Candidatus Woesearchaeota archaeon]